MRIAINVTPIKDQRTSSHAIRGTGFYTRNLITALQKYFPHHSYYFFENHQELEKDQFDIIHYPYFEPFFLSLPFTNLKKTIVTIHDLTPLIFPRYFPPGLKGTVKWKLQKMLLRKTRAIITDSNASRKDILKLTDIASDKVKTIYLAASEDFKKEKVSKSIFSNLQKKYNLPNKFILYVGDATWNKNLLNIMNAAISARIPLVMVGKSLVQRQIGENPWNQSLTQAQQIAFQNPQSIVLTGFVSNHDLLFLYNSAEALIMPSYYEGFGLPILEAMICGCPVITSKNGSIPEVAEDAALYVDANSVVSIADSLREIYDNDDLKEKLAMKGLKQAKKFNWRKTAEQTVKVYEG